MTYILDNRTFFIDIDPTVYIAISACSSTVAIILLVVLVVTCIRFVTKSTSCSFTREIWQYENIDLELFNNKMNEINWNEMIGFLNDVDDMVEEFTNYFWT